MKISIFVKRQREMNFVLLVLLVLTLIKTGRVVKQTVDGAVAHDVASLNDFMNSIKLLLKPEKVIKWYCQSQCLNQRRILRRISELRSTMIHDFTRKNKKQLSEK